MRFLVVLLSFIIFFGAEALAFNSEVLQQLWDVPTKEAKYQTIKSYNVGRVHAEEVYYLSRSYERKSVLIFGYFCYPIHRSGKLPAILLSHGGGGTASLERAVNWASRGYAVLAIDLPGKGENRSGSRSTGPNMDVENLLRTQPDPSYNYLIHAVAAARNGITFLSKRKEVDPDRIGMIGLSWGGVLTLLTNGQDNRLKAAVNVFGAGYIPEGCTWENIFNAMPVYDKEVWEKYLDPKNFLATQHAPILFVTGTNDHCYYLTTFQKSYEEVKVAKNIWLIPNLRHKFLSSAQSPALTWLDQKLKRGGIFPEITVLSLFQKGMEKIIIPVRATVSSSIKNVRLYYAKGGPQQWTEKKWIELVPYQEKGLFYFAIPASLVNPELLFYVNVKDNHGGAASSLIRSLFAVKLNDGTLTYALSSPAKKIYRHEKPIKLLNGMDCENNYFYLSKQDNAYKMFNPH
jgi:cephalosporin-C deacetylase-like acetyl esterase